eukprot:7648968-Pyramimonas_sp.AAC.1
MRPTSSRAGKMRETQQSSTRLGDTTTDDETSATIGAALSEPDILETAVASEPPGVTMSNRVGRGSAHSGIPSRSIARSRCISRPGAALSDPEI